MQIFFHLRKNFHFITFITLNNYKISYSKLLILNQAPFLPLIFVLLVIPLLICPVRLFKINSFLKLKE